MQADVLSLPPASYLPFIHGANLWLWVLGLTKLCFTYSSASMSFRPRFPPLSPSFLPTLEKLFPVNITESDLVLYSCLFGTAPK